MKDHTRSEKMINGFIEQIEENCSSKNILEISKNIQDKICIKPEVVIVILRLIKTWDKSATHTHTEILFLLLDEALSQVRYGIDRNDKHGSSLLIEIQETLNVIFPIMAIELRPVLNHILFESKLKLDIDTFVDQASENIVQPDISPRLPEILEKLRREKVFKTSFQLLELLLPQIQLLPDEFQIALMIELAKSKKPITHDLAVLMLLHPKSEIRKWVALAIYQLCDERHFTSIDLRRLIMIRNWVPHDERGGIDQIILTLRKNALSPAPHPRSKIVKLVSSSMDGAGVICIMIETKNNNQRSAGGFLVKIGVGIRGAYIRHKVAKNHFEESVNYQQSEGLPFKSVSKAFVCKLVQHFLAESIEKGNIPEPGFVEIAELFGADNWQPQPLSWPNEIGRLHGIYAEKLADVAVEHALARSAEWHGNQDFAKAWFDTGDIVENATIEAMNKSKEDPSLSVDRLMTDGLMAHNLGKWKTILLITCLWMRSKEEHTHCANLFTILHALDTNIALSSIPLIKNIALYSMASLNSRLKSI